MEALIVNEKELNQARAEVFKALGHPARMAMVDRLRRGEACVCELRDLVGLDMSTVSKHLAVLRAARVVSTRREGSWIRYSLRLTCVDTFLSCLDNVLKS